MAEMTKDMYGAIGRVGNKTYYQRMGMFLWFIQKGSPKAPRKGV